MKRTDELKEERKRWLKELPSKIRNAINRHESTRMKRCRGELCADCHQCEVHCDCNKPLNVLESPCKVAKTEIAPEG